MTSRQRKLWVMSSLIAGVVAVVLLAWRSSTEAQGLAIWEGTAPLRPYPFEGPPRFEFATSSWEMERTRMRANRRARADGALRPFTWRGFGLEWGQADALLPADEGWHIHPVATRMPNPGRLVLELVTNRAPESPLFEVAGHMGRGETLILFAFRVPDGSDSSDHGAFRLMVLEPDGLRVLAEAQLGPEQGLPPRSPQFWRPGWPSPDVRGVVRSNSPSSFIAQSMFAWFVETPAKPPDPRHLSRSALEYSVFTELVVSPEELAALEYPAWFLRWRYEPD